MNQNILRNIGTWESPNLAIDLPRYPSNTTYMFDQTLTTIKVSEDTMVSERIQDMRKAAEVHRQARKIAQNIIKPGIKLIDICETIENKIVDLFQENNLHTGIGFPVGVSVNNIAAHDGTNPQDIRILKKNDVCKIDFGSHVNGNIIDSAFTVAFEPKYDNLLNASKEGTWTGIKMCGPDVLISEISKEIEEVIESYEVTLNGKTIPVKSVINLGGHTIEPYKIHAGKLVLSSPKLIHDNTIRMKEGECYAIETFASTGSGKVKNDMSLPINNYMLSDKTDISELKLNISQKIYYYLRRTRSTLPFCTRWLFKEFGNKYKIGLNELWKNGLVKPYAALSDIPKSYVSQLEHTIYLHEYGKEVLSYGDDY